MGRISRLFKPGTSRLVLPARPVAPKLAEPAQNTPSPFAPEIPLGSPPGPYSELDPGAGYHASISARNTVTVSFAGALRRDRIVASSAGYNGTDALWKTERWKTQGGIES